jgi:NDP-4-keto-2,6-dideoxyhexose 3-C-methyltransferase
MIYKEIKSCRICGNHDLEPIIEFGEMTLTGVFPRAGEIIDRSPLELVKCSVGKTVTVAGWCN